MATVSVASLEEFIETWNTKPPRRFRPGEDAYQRGYNAGEGNGKRRVLDGLRELIREQQFK